MQPIALFYPFHHGLCVTVLAIAPWNKILDILSNFMHGENVDKLEETKGCVFCGTPCIYSKGRSKLNMEFNQLETSWT